MEQHCSEKHWPGDHEATWALTSSQTVPSVTRASNVPYPESVEEVAKWEDPDGFNRTELVYAPILWLLFPIAALGYLIYETITDPTGSEWSITVNDENVDAWPEWMLWLIWIGVFVWLLIAIGILVFRRQLIAEAHADNEWIYRHGIVYSVHRSPYDSNDGEGGTWPTFIALDHRLPDDSAARIHFGLKSWLSNREVQEYLGSSSAGAATVISSTDLFGIDATGGYYLHSIPGFGTAADFEAHDWVIITPPRGDDQIPTITKVPQEKRLQRIRTRLRRRAARSRQK